MKLPQEPQYEQCRVVIDTREQEPYNLSPLTCTVEGLPTGDYALAGEFSNLACIERKSLPDFVSSCSGGRERFDRELDRMLAYPVRAIVVEATWDDIVAGQWRARVKPGAIRASITSFISRGIPVMLASDRAGGQQFTIGLLWRAWLHEYRRLRQISLSVEPTDSDLANTIGELLSVGASIPVISRAIGVTQNRVKEIRQKLIDDLPKDSNLLHSA